MVPIISIRVRFFHQKFLNFQLTKFWGECNHVTNIKKNVYFDLGINEPWSVNPYFDLEKITG